MFTGLEKKIDAFGLHNVYIVFMLIVGTMLAFVTPIYQIPDEPAHLHRAWQISEGHFRAVIREHDGRKVFTADFPETFWITKYSNDWANTKSKNHYYSITDIKNSFVVPVGNKQTFSSIENTGAYAPVAYLPQATAAFMARNLNFSVGGIFYAMRIASVLFVAICIFFALKILPEKKLLIFLVAAMPMFLYQSASFSSDATVFAVCLLITAYLLSLRRSDEKFSRREISCILLAAVAVGLLKQVYGVILLLYFLIPCERMGGKKNFWLFGFLMLAAYLLAATAWIVSAAQGQNIEPHTWRENGANIHEQFAFVQHNILSYMKIFLYTLTHYIAKYMASFVGSFGWLQLYLPHWFYVFYGAFLVMGGIFGNIAINIRQRFIMLAGFVLVVFFIFLHIYLTWMAVGAPIIGGVQGRYFVPLALMLFAALSCRKKFPYENILACTGAVTSAAVTLYTLIDFYY